MTFREELEQIMGKELNILMELKQIAFEKTDMIINNRTDELEKITKTEETLINQMANLEKERERLLDTWGVQANTPISNVMEKIPGDCSGLLYIVQELKNTIEELSQRNILNNDLIEENLSWIDFNINLMTNTYMEPGYGSENKNISKNKIFDKKV